MTRTWLLAALPLFAIVSDLVLGTFLTKHAHASDGINDAFGNTESDAYRIANGEDEGAQDEAEDDAADDAEDDAQDVTEAEGEAEGDQTMEERLASHKAAHSETEDSDEGADAEEDAEAAAESADSAQGTDADDEGHDSEEAVDLDRVDPADSEEDDDEPAMLQKSVHGHRSGARRHAAEQVKVSAVYDPIHGDQARYGMYDFAHLSHYGDRGGGISVLDATAARRADRQIIAERDEALQRDEEDASSAPRANEHEEVQGPAVSPQGLDEPQWG